MTEERRDTRQRVFFGLACPTTPELRAVMTELRRSEVSREGLLRVMPEANLHLTLRYIGPVPAHRIGALCGIGQQLAGQYQAFTCSLRGAGHFSNSLWIGAEVPSHVHELVARMDRLLLDTGFPDDRMPFRPHVTVARAARRSSARLAQLRRLLTDRRFGEVPVDAVYLYRSDPVNGGSRYTPIGEFPL